ncbi:ATP-binding cassette domain-containing protein [Marinisporobacter balticus]|uniref:ATP-binding cassette domain-containing protein n=1 Tax=Marinisporobacter balticus TaxID=2018667 RepID=UPI00242FA81F|nr:ATP-binding cassette domain-containing protein [Marinisporobacter balticus]
MLELKNRQIEQLSGGQLQKVLIARALITDSKILILSVRGYFVVTFIGKTLNKNEV